MLLVECNVLEKVEVINEGKEGNTRLRLRGKFQQCDEQNNNGRIYPRKILESQVKAIQEKISDRSLVGALDHPANDAIHLSQASHLITGLNVDKDGSVIGECEILSTPNGKIVEALINDGVKIGISSRGVGSVTEGIKGKIVNEDFKLITFDLVSDPSTRGAFPELTESIRENSQRAQEIVSKHKKDRVLLTMLESKISEALKGKQKKLDKNKNGKLDSEDFKMLRGDRADEKFPDLSGDGKVTQKDILIGKGVIKGKKKKKKVEEGVHDTKATSDQRIARAAAVQKGRKRQARAAGNRVTVDDVFNQGTSVAGMSDTAGAADAVKAKAKKAQDRTAKEYARASAARMSGQQRSSTEISGKAIVEGKKKKSMEEGSIKDNPEAFKKAKAEAEAKGQQTEMPKPPKRDVKAAVVEGLKRICWGDRYDEGDVKRMNKRRRQAMDTRAGAQRPSLATPDTARSKAYDALKGDFSRVAKSYLKAKEYGRSGEAAAARARARATGIRAPVKPKKPNNQ